ncbi:MAG: hypothetical protein FWF66_03910 [Candidatus Bathyarchaeota archaeon]|nr:hypothetical protein [Candidatus Termiticorpusculum sp.]
MANGVCKFVISVLMMCLCVFGMFIPVVTARDAFAPSWLKEGAYVKYEPSSKSASSLGAVGFFDLSNPKFAGTNYMLSQQVDAVLETISSSLVWRCIGVNSTMAKLQITLDYVGKPSFYVENLEWVNDSFEEVPLQRTAEVYVDLYTRAVYNVEGVFLGTTHLWLPANPNDDQEIIIWEENSETITTAVEVFEQGKHYTFETGPQVTIKNQPLLLGLTYNLNTGLGVGREGGQSFRWDPIFAAVGISYGTVGMVTETNIDLGPEHSETNWMQILYYAIIPVAIILLIVTLIVKRTKKKR